MKLDGKSVEAFGAIEMGLALASSEVPVRLWPL
jgi:hypothetical protein